MRAFSWILALIGGALVATFLAYASFSDHIETSWAIAGVVGVLLVAAWVSLARDDLSAAASSPGARYTLTAVAMTLLVGGIIIAVNVLGHRYDKRTDLTASHRFTLSDQSVQIAAALEMPVTVRGFFPTGSAEESDFKDLMARYAATNTKIDWESHDPVREPMLAREYELTQGYGTVVMKAGENTQRLESTFDEEAITNAFIQVSSSVRHSVCFTQGHGELDPEDPSGTMGMGAAITKLEGQNYDVSSINLLREGRVPATCEIVVVADPSVDWLPPEREMLAAWLVEGGSVILMLEPTHTPGLAADMARYGIQVGDDLILETNPNYQLVGGDASYILLDQSSFDFHEITQPLKGAVVMRLVRTVGKGEEVPGINVQELAHTTDYAWAETDLTSQPQPDEGIDRIGKVPVMAVATITADAKIPVGDRTMAAAQSDRELALTLDGEAPPSTKEAAPTPKAGGRLLVVGDVDFATNALVDEMSNRDLFLNAISWLAGEEAQVSVRTNEGGQAGLSMNLIEGLLVWLTSLIFVPLLALGGAIATWRKRREL